jgi:hypothetical protein
MNRTFIVGRGAGRQGPEECTRSAMPPAAAAPPTAVETNQRFPLEFKLTGFS